LLDLGYRIRPQVPVGGYAIDFVVEGSDDRRLAIELDGDKYHGPDKWAEDVKRQRALERLGWIFWRCWGSAWISDREGCLADLMATLHRLGIEPIGTGEIGGAYTEHIEVRVQTDAEPMVEESVPAEPTLAEPALQFGQATPRERLRQRSRSATQRLLPLGFAARQSHRAGSIAAEPNVELPAEDVSFRSGKELVSAPPVVQDMGRSGGVFADLDSIVAEVGDLVFIRYNDQPDHRLSIRLSVSENNPSDGVVHVRQPLGTAILGASVDEEITVKIGNRTRTAVIEKIEKPRPVEALAAE
jgi:very-short-patch-repair endonuclease